MSCVNRRCRPPAQSRPTAAALREPASLERLRGLRALFVALVMWGVPERLPGNEDYVSPSDQDLRAAAAALFRNPEFRHLKPLERLPHDEDMAENTPETTFTPSAGDLPDTSSSSSEQSPSSPGRPQLPPNELRKLFDPPAESPQEDHTPTTQSSPSQQAPPARPNLPSSSGQSDGPPHSPAPSQRPTKASADKPASSAKTNASPPTTASPQQSSRRTQPALRGDDGIERPVRFSLRQRTPDFSPESELSDWQLPDLSGLDSLVRWLGGILQGLAYATLVVICIVILVLVAQSVWNSWDKSRHSLTPQGANALAHDGSPGETSADVYLERALQLADRGQYHAALAHLLLGGMSWIERRDWIRYRRGLTARDYLRSIRNHPLHYQGLKLVIEAHEPVEYGRRSATQAAFAAALRGYRAAFGPTAPGDRAVL